MLLTAISAHWEDGSGMFLATLMEQRSELMLNIIIASAGP